MAEMLREGSTINGEPFTEQAFINLLIQLGHKYYQKKKGDDDENIRQDSTDR